MFDKIFTTVKYLLATVNFLFVGHAHNDNPRHQTKLWLSTLSMSTTLGVYSIIKCQITGIIILSVGISVQTAYNDYYHFLAERFFSLPAFCIATGIIIFLVAAAGFYGAFMENYLMNMAFAAAMVVLLIFQVSACIAGFALKGNTLALVQQQLTSTMVLYGPTKDFEITKLWDEVQEDFQCCGVTNSSDWLVPLGTQETLGLPISCCSPTVGAVQTFTCNTTIAYEPGCADAFGAFVSSHAGSIGIAGVFLILMQALAVSGALWMAKISREERGAYP